MEILAPNLQAKPCTSTHGSLAMSGARGLRDDEREHPSDEDLRAYHAAKVRWLHGKTDSRKLHMAVSLHSNTSEYAQVAQT